MSCDQTFNFGYDIKYGIQAIATDGTSLICANYGGVSLVNPAFTSFGTLGGELNRRNMFSCPKTQLHSV